MARQTLEQRNAKQRERQQRLRDRHRAERRPDRDDVARTMLFWAITGYLREDRSDRIDQLADAVTALLLTKDLTSGRHTRSLTISLIATHAMTDPSEASLTCGAEDFCPSAVRDDQAYANGVDISGIRPPLLHETPFATESFL